MTNLLFPSKDEATATISPCGLFRYDLTRKWGEGDRTALFVMLNPSKADASVSDPTMTRCVSFAKGWGFDGMAIVNLFAFRATDPRELLSADDAIGPKNDRFITKWAKAASVVVCAWGSFPRAKYRAPEVLFDIREAGAVPMALKLTKDGHPCHPLYLKGNLRPIPLGAS